MRSFASQYLERIEKIKITIENKKIKINNTKTFFEPFVKSLLLMTIKSINNSTNINEFIIITDISMCLACNFSHDYTTS